MKFLIVQIALFSLAACASVARNQEWEAFKVKFNREFKGLRHESERREVFESNLDLIESHNALYAKGLSGYKMGINQFTDMTYEEFSSVMLMDPASPVEKTPAPQMKMKARATPDAYDARDDGLLNPVKDQASCGSCWAFSAVGSMEAAWAKAGNELISLSEQMLVDPCGPGDCNGGWVDRAFDTLLSKGGDELETDYPYTARNGASCKYDPAKKAASIAGYERVMDGNSGNIQGIADSVYEHGPHSIYVYANSNFQHYSSGIFDDPSCSKSSYNHAIINVGFDMGQGYWIVRNSWAESWGEDGYIRMKSGENICNCEHYVWYPYA